MLRGNKKLNFYPAIDLRLGNCVRLEKGNVKKEKIFNLNPIEQAQEFEKAKQAFEKTVALQKNHTNAYYGLIKTCARLGLSDEMANREGTTL